MKNATQLKGRPSDNRHPILLDLDTVAMIDRLVLALKSKFGFTLARRQVIHHAVDHMIKAYESENNERPAPASD